MPEDAASLAATTMLVGIDDTDTPEVGGTVGLARRLLETFDRTRMGGPLGATRHQLVSDPAVAATSHNASVALALKASHRRDMAEFAEFAGEFLVSEAVAGSNPGLALAREEAWTDRATAARLADFGARAKRERVSLDEARVLAAECGVHLSGHGGSGAGMIGALAAVGLHISGSDGRFVWVPGMADAAGKVTYRQLLLLAGIDAAQDAEGREPGAEEVVDIGERLQPVLLGGRVVVLLDPPITTSQAAGFGARPKPVTTWHAAGPEVVRRH
jgi:hypothetical protein